MLATIEPGDRLERAFERMRRDCLQALKYLECDYLAPDICESCDYADKCDVKATMDGKR